MQKGTWIICIDPYGKCETPDVASAAIGHLVNGDLVCDDCYQLRREMMLDHQEESKYI